MNKQTPLFLLSFMLLISVRVYAQTDDLRKEILNHKDPHIELIIKGRSLVLENYVNGHKQKTKELLTYLVNQEDSSDILPFYSGEKMLLYYWVGEHDKILDILSGRDTILYDKIDPPADGLPKKLVEYARIRRDSIRIQIDNVLIIDLQTKAFLKLKYDDLIQGYTYKITIDSLNKDADDFLRKYPNSRYEEYIRNNIREVYKRSNWGLGFEFFTGYGIFTKQLSEKFTNPIPFGMAIDIQYKNFSLSLRDYLSYTEARQSFPFSTGIWNKGDGSLAMLPEVALGYVVLDYARVKFTPFLGIAGTYISHGNKDVETQDFGLGFTRTYTVGLCFDWKFKPAKNQSKNSGDEKMIRMRYSYNAPQFQNEYSGFSGAMHSITIGISGFSRPYLRSF